MSREDPQLRIRLPIELKEKIEVAAKENTRSMNAEIVQRLEMSFLNEVNTDDLIPAKDVVQIAKKAREELSGVILKRTFAEINKKARIGHTEFCISLSDLELEILDEEDFFAILSPTFEQLNKLGYEVSERTIDNNGFLIGISDKNHTSTDK
ncbi:MULTISPECIES: Arc family DNA-binding protein [Providencia]|uniref:Arc family DNA-binding protein n=1 Tax=Providencia TaxID=586 RepID=UPI0012B6383E|nr:MULTISPECIES: Arc family DNA-binding protein [Providencia]MTC55221.1 Arc family DNA-binding protein [Providencia rustigianii]